MGKTLFLQVEREAIPQQVILVGDPGRVHLFAPTLHDPSVLSNSREFTFLSGKFRGMPIGVVSTGIGSPAAALVLEELSEANVRTVLRAGTMIAIGGRLGDFVLAQRALRYEGVSSAYAPPEIPATPDGAFFRSAWRTLSSSRERFLAGPVATVDAFYRHLFPPDDNGRRRGELLHDLRQQGVIAADMETSAIYVVGRALGIRALSVCLLSVSAFPWRALSGEDRTEREKMLVKLALEVMYDFVEGDDDAG